MAEPQSDTLKTPPINCSTELGQESGCAVLQSPSPAKQEARATQPVGQQTLPKGSIQTGSRGGLLNIFLLSGENSAPSCFLGSPAAQGYIHPTESEAMATTLPSYSFGAVFLNLVKNTFCNKMLVSF